MIEMTHCKTMKKVGLFSDPDDPGGRRKRAFLKSYYGLEGETNGEIPAPGDREVPRKHSASTDPCDINSQHFQPDVYLTKLIQVSGIGSRLVLVSTTIVWLNEFL